MPTIKVIQSDLERLAGQSYALPELGRALEFVKAEAEPGELPGYLRIQLKDTNRPDLWSSEGVARLLKGFREKQHPDYGFFRAQTAERELRVGSGMQTIRPYIAAFACEGIAVDEAALEQLIEAQEKLAEGYGRGRSAVAIGIYDASEVVYPVSYEAADPDRASFVPLDGDAPMPLRQILKDHPTGRKYAHLLDGFQRFPLIRDKRGEVLSMPPIINSQTLGRVEAGDTHLFCEATGTELDAVLLSIAILAANMADRGGAIHPVRVTYPYDTPRGRSICCPSDLTEPIRVDMASMRKVMGADIGAEQIEEALKRMGYRGIEVTGSAAVARPAPYRDDILHPVDLIEDVIIAVGYDHFKPEMPRESTVGKAAPQEEQSDRFRSLMVGCGFQEMFLPILGSREAQADRMRNPDASLVEIANPMSVNYSSVRGSLLPGLMRVESVSRRAKYPHRMFEVGEVAVIDSTENYGTRTAIRLCAVEVKEDANLSDIQSYLEAMAYYLAFDYKLRPIDHPTFLPGRAGEICVGEQSYGIIGEVHPEVLEMWGIAMPVSAFEIDIRIAEGSR